jgi:hypothetical protein
MWLACALIILFSVGFVLPCMLDVMMTPDSEFTILSKRTWLLVVGAFSVLGAAAWLLAGRPRRATHRRRHPAHGGIGPAQALLRHPATQAAGGYADVRWLADMGPGRPVGPDDDPDFLLELDRRIREIREEG